MTTIHLRTVADSNYGLYIYNPMKQHPFIFSDERKYRIQRHLVFWFIWWFSMGILYSFIAINEASAYRARLSASFAEALVYLAVHMFLSYSLMYFVLPRYLLKQKYLLTTIWVIALFFITAFFSSILSITVIEWVRNSILDPSFIDPRRTVHVNIFLSLMAGLRGAITIGGLACTIKLMKYWYMKEQRNLQLQKENVEAQLQLLKAQVHPHFLFNTLNNIYAYTQNTSATASSLVMGLSDMLRYMLYECNQPLVPLQKELKMLEDYIMLEKIRYDNKLDIHIDLPQKADNIFIAPLVLLPFVENCFKHGASHMLDQPWISLTITLSETKMEMKLINGKPEAGKTIQTKTNGIGIINARKRLDLLYLSKHELRINNEEDIFVVDLKLELERRTFSAAIAQPSIAYNYA